MAGLLIRNLTEVIKLMLITMGLWKIKHVNNFKPLFTKKKNTLIEKSNKVDEIYVAKITYYGSSVLTSR